jgi:hypothetical protein
MKKLTAMLLTFCFAAMIVGCTDEAKPKSGDKGGSTTKATTETKAK